MGKHKKKKPEIRFKGFTDDWEQRKFEDLFAMLKNNTLSRAELSEEEGCALNVHYGDVLVQYNEILDVANSNLPMAVSSDITEKYKSSYLQDGDVVIADTAEDESVGKCCEIAGAGDNIILAGLHTMPVRPIIKFASKYLGFYLNSPSYHRQLIPLMQGTKVTSISKSSIKDTTVLHPNEYEEQNQIGEYFDKLDHLITLHQRKLNKLKKVKKSMLEKMFPQNGEMEPQIRFCGFNSTWEQRKLGDYIIEYQEVTTENNQYPPLTSSRKGIFLQKDYFAGNQIASTDNTGYNIVPFGYFTYRHMSDDEIFHFNINDIIENGIVSTLYPVFTTTKGIDSKYLQYQLNHGYEFTRYALSQKQGGSRTYMYLNKLKMLHITIPTAVKEQKAIANCLMKIDNLITLHQRKLEKLKKIKKALLEKMFV